MSVRSLKSRGKELSLGKPLVMGVLNVTPDSFSDGGDFLDFEAAVARGLEMARQGADIIDIGGESTGPGSVDVGVEEELERVVPVLEGLVLGLGAAENVSGGDESGRKGPREAWPWISIDTYKSEVARQALEMGVDMINDVTGLRGDEKMASVLSKYDVPVVIMYAKDPTARTSREAQEYDDVVATVRDFLEERILFAEHNGIARERIIVDPGMGAFVSAKAEYSLELLNRLQEFGQMDVPILIGASRKSFIGQVLNGGSSLSVNERLEGSLAAAAVAIMNGASIIRAHDVQETRRTVDMVHAIFSA